MCSMEQQRQSLEAQGKQTEVDSAVFKKIIKDTKDLGTKTILFIGGEPFVRKDLFELIGFTRAIGINPIIVTNGVLLNEDNITKCLESGVDWLSISIDAATEKTFSKIRGEQFLDKIIKNIELLNNIKAKRGKEFPKVVVVCTIMDENLDELLDVVCLSRKLGVARVLFQPVVANNIDQTQRKTDFPGFVNSQRIAVLENAIDKLINYKKQSAQNYDFIGNSVKYLNLIKKYFKGTLKPGDLPCYAGYNRLQIVQEGKVYFCVNQEKHEANFGDISKDPLKQLWFSKRAKFYRKLIKKCASPCLQWCSYRDGFIELEEVLQKRILFGRKRNL